ncbi:hypothetical protein PR048_013488 [Dryococelus australis]|uniref:Integrase catalytic domain-containing protein n=1 Tax=Dryococelus australis TaxID=614101 RepID=A0ABQ9HTT6_9NEOP|nr:hypothetical protein PR048_013488 [Dryococelus australis]
MEYTFDIKYTSGKSYAHVDSLNRNPVELTSEKHEEKALELPVFSLPGFEIAKAQHGDPSLVPLIQEIEKPSKVGPKFSMLAKHFCLKDGIMYKLNSRPEGREKLLVVPGRLKVKMLSECHDNPLMGRHLCIVKTIDKIKRSASFTKMSRLILEHMLTAKPKRVLQPIPSGEHFHRIGTDLLGPFPKTNQSNKYIITRIDYGAAHKVAQFLLENVICRYSIPGSILSDRGQVFSSVGVCELLRVISSSYRPQCNGAVERLHATLTTMMSLYSRLPTTLVSRRVQDLVHFCLCIGVNTSCPQKFASIRRWTRQRASSCEGIFENIYKQQEKAKQHYDPQCRVVEYQPGQVVLIYTPTRK